MKDSTRPLALLSGVAVCLLGIAGGLAYPSEPAFVAEPAKLAEFYGANSDALLGANTLYVLSGSLLIVFAGVLASMVARTEGPGGRLSGVVSGGIVAGAALALGGSSLDAIAALRVEERGSIEPATAAALADGSDVLFGLGAPMAFGVAVLAIAVVAFRTALLPVWLAVVSGVLGVALLVPPINYVAVLVFLFWCLVTSLVLYLRPQAEDAHEHSLTGAERGLRQSVPAAASRPTSSV